MLPRHHMCNNQKPSCNLIRNDSDIWNRIEKLTCGRTSGRDSKMTSKTPIGTVTWVNSSPVDSRVRRMTRPTMFELLSAICFNPSLKLFNLAGVNVRRPRNGPTPPCFVVFNSFNIYKSSALAFKICGWRCRSNSAKFSIMSERWLPVKFCSWRPPSRAGQLQMETRIFNK